MLVLQSPVAIPGARPSIVPLSCRNFMIIILMVNYCCKELSTPCQNLPLFFESTFIWSFFQVDETTANRRIVARWHHACSHPVQGQKIGPERLSHRSELPSGGVGGR